MKEAKSYQLIPVGFIYLLVIRHFYIPNSRTHLILHEAFKAVGENHFHIMHEFNI